MPKGRPNKQTIATQKYQEKIGLATKGFKLRKELAEEFTRVCAERGESQASVISRLMEGYISENKRLQ